MDKPRLVVDNSRCAHDWFEAFLVYDDRHLDFSCYEPKLDVNNLELAHGHSIFLFLGND